MTRDEALAKARPIAEEAHCRYCDFKGQDSRLKCKRDVEYATEQIAAALMAAYSDGLNWCLDHQPGMTWGNETMLERNRARAEAKKLVSSE